MEEKSIMRLLEYEDTSKLLFQIFQIWDFLLKNTTKSEIFVIYN